MIWRTKRTARKQHRCDCGIKILPGDLYIDAVASPNHDGLGNIGWWRISSCYDCAVKYNRV